MLLWYPFQVRNVLSSLTEPLFWILFVWTPWQNSWSTPLGSYSGLYSLSSHFITFLYRTFLTLKFIYVLTIQIKYRKMCTNIFPSGNIYMHKNPVSKIQNRKKQYYFSVFSYHLITFLGSLNLKNCSWSLF